MSTSVILMGQLERSGVPVSWSLSQTINGTSLWQDMPLIDREALIQEDAAAASDKSIPYRFGYAHPVNYNTDNSGQWTNLQNGDRVWLLGINCNDASSVALTFSNLSLPRGSRLYIYSENHDDYVGPIDSKANSTSLLSIPHIKGSKIYVEYYEPYAFRGRGEIGIKYVTESYRDFSDVLTSIDPGCLQFYNGETMSAANENASSSVMMMLVDYGQRLATATLLNNSSGDGTPYALISNTAIVGSPTSWVFLFDYSGTDCISGMGNCRKTAICGAQLVKTDYIQGVSLVRLNDHPKDEWKAFYSGWKLSQSPNQTTYTCLQHAFGLPQSISNYSGQLESLALNNQNIRALSNCVFGATFQGSLGSPLFDADKNLIGIFVGGNSSCSGSGEDHFAMLSDSWSEFKDYLDPFQIVSDKISGFYAKNNDENSNEDEIKVTFFPNPAHSWIYVQNDGNEMIQEIRIHDASGRLIKILRPQVPTVSIEDLDEGLYTITFVFERESRVQKLLIR